MFSNSVIIRNFFWKHYTCVPSKKLSEYFGNEKDVGQVFFNSVGIGNVRKVDAKETLCDNKRDSNYCSVKNSDK